MMGGMMAGVGAGAAQRRRPKKLLPVTRVGPLREDPAQLERVPVRELSDEPTR